MGMETNKEIQKLRLLIDFDVSKEPMTREEFDEITKKWRIPKEMLVAITGVSRPSIYNYIGGRAPFKPSFAVAVRQLAKFCEMQKAASEK